MVIKSRLLLPLCVLACFAGAALSDDSKTRQTPPATKPGASPNAAEAQDIAILKKAGVFAIGGFGFTGAPGPEDKALRGILKADGASKTLQSLLKEANLSGQLYALAGLRECDRAAFDTQITPYLKMKSTVSTGAGCIISMKLVSDVAGEIQAGRYDRFLSPAQPAPVPPSKLPA